jgi:hypothetical protein
MGAKATNRRPLAKALSDALGELDDSRAAKWKAALERNKGVVKDASDDFDFSRQRGHFLTKQYGLQEYARELKKGAHAGRKTRPE